MDQSMYIKPIVQGKIICKPIQLQLGIAVKEFSDLLVIHFFVWNIVPFPVHQSNQCREME